MFCLSVRSKSIDLRIPLKVGDFYKTKAFDGFE